jgi:hypothetical protein
MSPETETLILTQLERIADALETLNARLDAALGPGDAGRNSVTILDQLCALTDDTQTLVSALTTRQIP